MQAAGRWKSPETVAAIAMGLGMVVADASPVQTWMPPVVKTPTNLNPPDILTNRVRHDRMPASETRVTPLLSLW